jgi:hypothetical protein
MNNKSRFAISDSAIDITRLALAGQAKHWNAATALFASRPTCVPAGIASHHILRDP